MDPIELINRINQSYHASFLIYQEDPDNCTEAFLAYFRNQEVVTSQMIDAIVSNVDSYVIVNHPEYGICVWLYQNIYQPAHDFVVIYH